MRYQLFPVVQVLRATVTALLVTLLGTGGIFLWAAVGQSAQLYAAPAAFGVTVVSLLAGGIRAGLTAQRKGWFHGAITGNLYALVMSWLASLWYPSFGVADGLLWLSFSMALGAAGGSAGINLGDRLKRRSPGFDSYRFYS